MRKTIYISERRSKAIADFIKGVPDRDVSFEAVKLMEDGMKWRGIGNDVDNKTVEEGSSGKILLPKDEISVSETSKADFSGIKLQRKKIEKSVLESKLNDL